MLLPPSRPETLSECRALYLKRLGEVLKEAGNVTPNAVAAILEGVGEYFDEVVDAARRGSFLDEASGLTSSRLTLVSNDDLELSIRLDNLGSALAEATGASLWKTYLRFVTLLSRPDLPKEDNPIGPRGIARGLEAMLAAAGAVSLDRKEALIDRLEFYLRQKLPDIYRQIEAFLVDAGVEAAQPNIVIAQEAALKGGAPASLQTPGVPLAQPPAAGAAAVIGDPPAPSALPLPGSVKPSEPLSGLMALQQMLLAQQMLQAGSAYGTTAARASQSMPSLEQLRYQLAEMERRQLSSLPEAVAQPINEAQALESLIPDLFGSSAASASPVGDELSAAALGLPAATPEGLLVDTLATILDLVGKDKDLPEALRLAVASLRIRLIKLALEAQKPIDDPQNPARLMIDGLAAALHGLPPETERTHPRCVRVLAIVESLRVRGDVPGAFDQAIAQLGDLARERGDELKRFGDAYLPLVDHLEKNDLAKQAAYEVMGRLAGKEVPKEILFFFTEIWRHVLQRAWLKFGPDRREFQVLAKVPEELLWSLTPKSDPEERKLLSQRVPDLLKRMRSGLEFARQPGELVTRVLDICFALQTRVLRPQDAAPGGIATVPLPRMGGAREIVMRTVRKGELALQSMDFRDPGQLVPERSACEPGTWMWITLGNQRRTLYFSALSPGGLRAVLVNPDEAPAMAIHLAILDKILLQQGIRIQRPGSLFEASANRAVRGFRAG